MRNVTNSDLRVCAVAYPREPIRSWEEMESTVQSFVEGAHKEGCRVALFPEAFTETSRVRVAAIATAGLTT